MNLRTLTSRIPKRTPPDVEPTDGYALGHVLVGEDGTWLMYRYPTAEWSSADDQARETALDRYAGLLVSLLGRHIQEWVTFEPFPAVAYYAGMMTRYPNASASFREYVEAAARAAAAGDVHRAFLGVRLTKEKLPTRTVEIALGQTVMRDDQLGLARWGEDIRKIDSITAAAKCRPLTRKQIGALTDSFDWFGLGDGVTSIETSAVPYGTTVELHGIRDGLPVESHVQVLRGDTFYDREDTGQWPWLAWPQTLPYRVVASRKGDILDAATLVKGATLRTRQNRSITTADTDEGFDARGEVVDGAERALQVRTEMVTGSAAQRHRFSGRVMYAVAADTPEAAAELGRALVSDAAAGPDSGGILTKLTLNYGQHSDWVSMRPGKSWTWAGHITTQPLTFAATACPYVSQSAGDGTGMVVGPMADSRDWLIHDPWGAAHPNQSKLHTIVGGLGSGKSSTAGKFIDYAAQLTTEKGPVQAVVNDPSGNLTRLAELPWLRRDARVLKVTEGGQDGMLMPHFLVAEPRRGDYLLDEEYEEVARERASERVRLAVDMTLSQIPWSVRESDRGTVVPAVEAAVAEVGSAYGTHSREIIDALEKEDAHLARMLRATASYGSGPLIFPKGEMSAKARAALESDATLTMVTAPGLSIPDPGMDKRSWGTEHHAAVPILLGMSRLTALVALSGPSGPLAEPKMHVDDELGLSAASSHGSFLARMSVETRRKNLASFLLFQTMSMLDQLPNSDFDSLIGPRFVGRLWGKTARLAADRLIGPEWVSLLPTLEDGQFVFSGWTGRPRLVQVAQGHHRPELIAALDTTPASIDVDVEGMYGAVR